MAALGWLMNLDFAANQGVDTVTKLVLVAVQGGRRGPVVGVGSQRVLAVGPGGQRLGAAHGGARRVQGIETRERLPDQVQPGSST